MSTAPKGYPCNQKLDRIGAEYASVMPVGPNQNGLAVAASLYVFQVGTDAVEAGTTASKVVATGIGAVARKGDLIRFTSGAMDGYEVSVLETATNHVIVSEDLSTVPSALDTFTIFRFIRPVATSGGGVASALSFTLDGVSTPVVEDTVTPANNIPLPVKLMGVNGSLTLTADQLNVQSTHTGANPDSMQIGDGTTLVGVTAANAMKVSIQNQTGMLQSNPPVYNDYTSTPVTTAAYVELVASVSQNTHKIQIFDSSGETMILALGAAGSETDLMWIFPGGIEHNVYIPVGQRLSIKAKSGNATSGYLAANLWSY
jgi:hypothetical protein